MLEVRNVRAGYGKREVLNGISVGFEKGKLTSVIGINGSGKSTLLGAILGMIPLTEGSVLIDGRELSDLGKREVAKRIAYLSQGRNTPDMTVRQMVLHGRFPHLGYPRHYSARDREIALRSMERVGISPLADMPLCSLSGGMRQNAYIAMALAQDTDYILLDEPMTYLDISHQLELMKILRELADAGKGIVAVMHDLPMALSFSDSVAVVDGGGLRIQTSPDGEGLAEAVRELFGVSICYSPTDKRYYYGY